MKYSYSNITIVLIIISASLNLMVLNAQQLEERLSQPITNCEIIATNSQNLMSTFDISQEDSILAVLAIWERECGNIEPIQRVKILLDIYNGNLEESGYILYFDEKVDNYKYRLNASKFSDYTAYYEENKTAFNYVKLRGDFDNWTKNIAITLVQIHPRGSEEHLICLLFSNNLTDFSVASKSKSYTNSRVAHSPINYDSYNHRGGFAVLIGAWQPIGKMTEKFTLSPQFGLGVNIPFGPKFRIDFKVLIIGLLNKKELLFNIKNEEVATTDYSNVNVGFLFSREFKLTEKYFFDINTGLSMASLSTEIEENIQNEQTNHYSIQTLNVELGVRCWRKIARYQNIGLNAAIHYVPYGIDKKLLTDVGAFYMDYTLLFKF